MKRIKLAIAILLVCLLTTTIFAGGYYHLDNKEITKEQAIEELSKFDDKSDEELAKIYSLSLESYKKIKDVSRYEPVEVSPILLRAPLCPNCRNGRMVHLGNECFQWKKVPGSNKACVHHSYGFDYNEERLCTARRRCESCFYEVTSDWTETQTWCVGGEDPNHLPSPHRH